MQYRRLGRTDLKVSLIGLGSGGRNRLGQNRGMDQEGVRTLVRSAIDVGVNVIDTAPTYGHSEELLGEALKGLKRSEYVLCTKFSPVESDVMASQRSLRQTLERSLDRLGTDFVDIYYLHRIFPNWLLPVIDRFYSELLDAQASGLIRFIAISESFQHDHEHKMLVHAAQAAPFDVMMVGHNLLSPSAADRVFPLCESLDIGVVVMCAIRGLLLDPGRVSALVDEWKKAGLLAADAVPTDDPLGALLGNYGTDLPSAAYRFAADHSAVGTVLTGTSDARHLADNVAAVSRGPLPRRMVQRVYDVFGPVSRAAGL